MIDMALSLKTEDTSSNPRWLLRNEEHDDTLKCGTRFFCARNWARHLQHAKTTSKMMSLKSRHWGKNQHGQLWKTSNPSWQCPTSLLIDDSMGFYYPIDWGLLQSCACCASPSNFFLFLETSYLADFSFCDAFKAVEGHWTTGRCSDEA